MKHANFLDKFFDGKNKKDILYIHVTAIFLIGFLIYYFIYPISSDFKKKEEENYKQNVTTLNKLKTQKNIFTSQVISLTKRIKRLTLIKNSLYKQKLFFDDLISLLDFAEFDKYKWALYVKNIVYNAKNEGLKLIDFKNYLYNEKDKNFIDKKMDIIINVKGEYKNLISYLYRYENRKELLRVSEFNISDKGEFMIKYSLYGYEQ
jgi:hypothetical protein